MEFIGKIKVKNGANNMVKKQIKIILMVCIVIFLALPVVYANDDYGEIENNEDFIIYDLPVISISLNGTTLEEINSGSKETKYQGNSLILKTVDNEQYDFEDSDVEIKGRGNFSWTLPKKSYQIKLSKKQNVLGMGKAKTWLLIANYADATLMRNKLTYDLAKELNMPYTQNSEWVELWVDGEYLGNYLLVEKIQINDNRVELKNSQGLLIEMDNNYFLEEINWFKSSKSGSYFVLKDSVADDEGEQDSQAEVAFNNFKNYINEFESYLYAKNKNWSKISSMIDVESFIKYYFINELTENADCVRTSMFMYKDGEEDVLHLGPVWDFDLALANCDKENWGGNPNVDYINNIKKYMDASMDWYTELLKIPEFRIALIEIYNNEIKPILSTFNEAIMNYKNILLESSNRNFAKWNVLGQENPFGSYRGHKIKDTYEGEVEYLSNWVEQRINYLNERYSDNSRIINIQYNGHIENIGWQGYKQNGEISGTTGNCKRLEALVINKESFNSYVSNNLKIKYQVYVDGYGWQNWKEEGEIAGTTGEARKIEAIRIKLNNPEAYSIQYKVHIEDLGWTDWLSNGEIAGNSGQNKRIEAIKIRLIETPKIKATYSAHVENIGWQPLSTNGEEAGTTGMGLRLEAIKVSLKNAPGDVKIKYKVHVENIGWQDWQYNNSTAGTTGEARRMEAIRIKLEGTSEYSVKYRVHIQDIGWTEWVKDGEIAGTTGQALRLEAIEIKIERK